MNTEKQPIFKNLDADDLNQEATEIESLCMNCHANGVTRLLLTKIPFYKDVVLMSFECEKCGYQNNEIQSGGPVAEKGIIISLKVETAEDLNRQVVRSDYTCIKIPHLEFEIPAKSQKGEITTIEGIIDRAVTGLSQEQPQRKIENLEIAKQIDEFINKLKTLKDLKESFTIIFEDISGNCFVENPRAPQKDERCNVHYFSRNQEQDHELGIYKQNEISSNENSGVLRSTSEDNFTLEDLEGEILKFPTNCNNCGSPCETNMKMTKIPYFKEVVIMATVCDVCGNRTNEVKSGGGIEPRGIRIEVDVKSKEDFSRDLLKSETCSFIIPQLELEVGPHALGGRFTTVEGIIVAVKDQLCDPNHSFMFGDSQDGKSKERLEQFIKKLDSVLAGEYPITIVLDDPAGNSYVQSLEVDNDKVDDNLKITHYERSEEQNEELGLNDIKTENY